MQLKTEEYIRDCALKELDSSRHGTKSWVTAVVGFLRNDGDFNSTFALMLVIFCIYSARILIVPLWYAPFIPIVSPLYMQQIHWRSNNNHFIAILLHVSSGIICLAVGLLQFNSSIRVNRTLHRWTGRIYIICGVICLYSLWQLQGIVGKGPDKQPSQLLQYFNIVCISLWSLSTYLAIFHVLNKKFVEHKKWMTRSFVILTTPLLQRASNVFLSFMLYWIVVLYALIADHFACSTRFSISGAFANMTMWETYGNCLLVSSPHWSSGPNMLSLEGFGEVEHLVFGASAWIGLSITLFTAEVGVASIEILEMVKGLHIGDTVETGDGNSDLNEDDDDNAIEMSSAPLEYSRVHNAINDD